MAELTEKTFLQNATKNIVSGTAAGECKVYLYHLYHCLDLEPRVCRYALLKRLRFQGIYVLSTYVSL